MEAESEKLTIPRFLTLFRKLSRKDQLRIAEEINQQTFAERWALLDADLPDEGLPEDEIMEEVRSVRYGKEARH